MVVSLRRSAWALVAALVSAYAGAARSDPPRVLSVQFVTRGSGLAYSQALGKIAFSRFDPQVLGAPDLLGREDDSGTFQQNRGATQTHETARIVRVVLGE